MRRKLTRIKIIAIAVLAANMACSCDRPQQMPVGDWQSCTGRPDLSILESENGVYSAVVFHKTYYGNVCPVIYPIIRTETEFYIQAEGRIVLSYDIERDNLFLSPGGQYRRKGNSRKTQLKTKFSQQYERNK